ncbi:MAG: hypothetical protein ABIQ27_10000, partial [Flavobacterium sp.]|uniref:hypothetical protein n=1 Tax=Flavobacterium sp. TaxID=239 RepID=UPI00326625C7
PPEIAPKVDVIENENFDEENTENVSIEIEIPEVENIVKTRILMPSRKLRIAISKEFLDELEKMKIKFSLN